MDAKERKKLKAERDRRNTIRTLTLVTQFGINMLVPVFLCFFGGMYLDRKLDTNYWVIIGFFVGAIAGFRNIYIFARRITKSGDDSSEK